MKTDADAGGGGGAEQRLFLGVRIRTYSAAAGSDDDGGSAEFDVAGVIVDDFGDLVDAAGQAYGRDWAVTKRWAVALDDGSLVFRDDNELDREK